MMDVGKVFGRGVSFPPRVDEEGRIAWSAGPDNIRESIRVILMTEPGERVMLRQFGAGLKRFLFQPNVVSTHRQIEDAISNAIGRWEQRVEVTNVSVTRAPDDDQAAVADIRYTLIPNNVEDQLRIRVQLTTGA